MTFLAWAIATIAVARCVAAVVQLAAKGGRTMSSTTATLTCVKDWVQFEIHQTQRNAFYRAVKNTRPGMEMTLDPDDLDDLTNGDQQIVIDATELARDNINAAQRLLEQYGFTVFYSANQYVRADNSLARKPKPINYDDRWEVRLPSALKQWVMENGGSELVRHLLEDERKRIEASGE
jgi:hypothetical protein